MRLTGFSDYALRTLMYAASSPERRFTIDEASQALGVSRAHLNKVVNTLTRNGYLTGIRGRSGGLMLGRSPETVRIGDVLRVTEPDFALVECFVTGKQCVLDNGCKLSGMLEEAMTSFLATLDRYTLADITLSVDFLNTLPSQRPAA